MSLTPRIAIDAMGGDVGVRVMLAGAAMARHRHDGLRFLLVGDEQLGLRDHRDGFVVMDRREKRILRRQPRMHGVDHGLAEGVERGCELQPAARDVRMRRLRGELRVLRHHFGGLAHRRAVRGDEAGGDGGLGPRPAFEEAALDEQLVRPALHGAGLRRAGSRSGCPARPRRP